MTANSEKTPSQGTGRVTPSQAGINLILGVCREHVLSPEGKICSELHRNMQRSAEMTDPAVKLVTNLQYKVHPLASSQQA